MTPNLDRLPAQVAAVFAELRAAIEHAERMEAETVAPAAEQAPAAYAEMTRALDAVAEVLDRLDTAISGPDDQTTPMGEVAVFLAVLAERHVRTSATYARGMAALPVDAHRMRASLPGEPR